MEGKWIEGFDKRYKIFEDGVVVSYVSKNPKVLKKDKNERVCLTKKGETKKIIKCKCIIEYLFSKRK